MAFYTKPETTPAAQEFYGRLSEQSLAPLWESLGRIIPPEPTPACTPVVWRYEDIRPLLMEAGGLLTPQQAERRVLVLENPGMRGRSQITGSLYAGIQLVLPGETAPCHRHVTSALRFVLEGTGAYTSVDGERTTMHPGDFIITPSWTFHEHANFSSEPVVWMDGLDLPMVNLFDTSFAEHYSSTQQEETRSESDSWARYGANLLPLDYQAARPTSPIFNYSYESSRQAIARLLGNGPIHPAHGVKMQYSNPATGGHAMPTIGAFLQMLPKDFRGAPYRSTDASIYCCVEGRGRTRVGDSVLEWGPRAIFVTPSWYPVSHESDAESILFSFSDRPAQKALGLWREQL